MSQQSWAADRPTATQARSAADCSPPQRLPMVRNAICSVQANIENLEHALGDLLGRIAPVCRQEPVKDNANGQCMSGIPCGLASDLEDQSRRIAALTEKVMQAMSLLEI